MEKMPPHIKLSNTAIVGSSEVIFLWKQSQFVDADDASSSRLRLSFGHQREKTCLRGFANNTGADQPAHTRSLISAFVTRSLKSTIFNLAKRKISIF